MAKDERADYTVKAEPCPENAWIDVSQKPKMKKASRSDIRVAANFANATGLALVSIDALGTIRFVNRATTELFGYEPGEMVGKSVEILIPERFRTAHTNGFARAIQGKKLNLGGRSIEVAASKRDGTEFPIELTLCSWHVGRRMSAGAVIKDITDRKERESRLRRLASRDVLTGLLNRNGFEAIVAEKIASGGAFDFMMLDIDGFKDLNAVNGHQVGDALLQSVALRLSLSAPSDAVLARMGPDEFALLTERPTDTAGFSDIVQTTKSSLSIPFEVAGQVFNVSVSGGVVRYPAHGADREELIASADAAMHLARAGGGGTVEVYDPTMKDEAVVRRALRDELLTALRNGELVLYYQPQVRLASGTIFGFEALIRWNHPTRGLLLPGAFLPALEESALALEIGWWTLNEACRAASVLNRQMSCGIKMGVNLFPGQLHSPLLASKVTVALDSHGLTPGLLELEVTETTALRDDCRSLDAMDALRSLGVGIAFDDFGTGYASLSSLQRYPLTTLKIDRGFIKDLSKCPKDNAITRALIAMSKDLGLDTIAEGIETAEQERCLISLGCPAAQGYRYGKPVTLESILSTFSVVGGTIVQAAMRPPIT